ncbi:DUF5610 domain-containing protein [Glaciecola siphonariae]|uniref:DUF5610 domain-containing protein n=1 Tax=Glaciecola siphonariae TaxID=521012 RepID=A0ABV9LYV9_9ALTE
MNMLEVKAAFPDISGAKAANVIELKHQNKQEIRASQASDTYSSSAGNDVVAAKVISLSINSRFEDTLAAKNIDKQEQSAKLRSVKETNLFNIDEVVQNVLSFVSSSLASMAKNGADKVELSYFKQQATEGVNAGIDQAKLELVGVADDKLTQNIDASQKRIIDEISKLPIDPLEYQKASDDTNVKYMQTKLDLSDGRTVRVDFGSEAFTSISDSSDGARLYTSQGSNISFSIAGEADASRSASLANLINSADELASTFYRKDMQQVYEKAIEQGYTDNDLTRLAQQSISVERNSGASAYDQVKHLNEFSNKEDMTSPKAVANYVARLMNVMESAKKELASEQEYNQVINGLVNEMKDVQVPDLLQAINRFHAFNAKFIAQE